VQRFRGGLVFKAHRLVYHHTRARQRGHGPTLRIHDSGTPAPSTFRVQGSGYRVQGAGFRVQGSGCRVQGAGFRVQGSGCRVQCAVCSVQGAGYRAQGAGCRVQGAGCRVHTALCIASDSISGSRCPPPTCLRHCGSGCRV